jgi:2-polyprenyl-6-methoxyphenol hydroxylase-like FAD-dependent oxidoreductase
VKPAVDVLVAGAGTTGLTLALQAHDHGARVRVIERRPEPGRPSRALIMHPRTLEVLRPLGVTDAILARANTAPEVRLHLGRRVVPARLDRLDMPDTAFPHLTLVRQADVEAVLTGALTARGIEVERGVTLIDARDEGDGVRATLRSEDGSTQVDAAFLAGCDGPGSVVREAAGVAWEGDTYAVEVVLADLELGGDLEAGRAHAVVGREGLLLLFPLGERAPWRLLATRRARGAPLPFGQPGPPVPAAELQALLDAAGLGARIFELAWSARYPLQHRVAARYRQGSLFLAGDAAHAWSPATGQGMNVGIGDAANLGWKLAFAPSAAEPEALLASYEEERRPLARRLLSLTHFAFWVESGVGPVPSFLRGVLAPLAAPIVPLVLSRPRLVAEAERVMSQMRASHAGSPLTVEGEPRLRTGPRAGHRLPDATVTVSGERVRLHALLARPGVHVLLHRDAAPPRDLAGPHLTVHRLESTSGPGVIVVRPDGHIGYRSGRLDVAQLRAWLARIGANA